MTGKIMESSTVRKTIRSLKWFDTFQVFNSILEMVVEPKYTLHNLTKPNIAAIFNIDDLSSFAALHAEFVA